MPDQRAFGYPLGGVAILASSIYGGAYAKSTKSLSLHFKHEGDFCFALSACRNYFYQKGACILHSNLPPIPTTTVGARSGFAAYSHYALDDLASAPQELYNQYGNVPLKTNFLIKSTKNQTKITSLSMATCECSNTQLKILYVFTRSSDEQTTL